MERRCAWMMRGLVGAALGCSVACAPAIPRLGGGSTTPAGRADVAAGAASRVPLGALRRAARRAPRRKAVGGVVPVGAARFGLDRQTDLGIFVAAALTRVELRRELLQTGDEIRTSLRVGAGPYGGWVSDHDASDAVLGITVPVVFAVEAASLAELWAGVSATAERRWASDPTNLWRAGATVGVATGFRRLHGLIELTVAYEHGSASADQPALSGWVLVPAFALRVRL